MKVLLVGLLFVFAIVGVAWAADPTEDVKVEAQEYLITLLQRVESGLTNAAPKALELVLQAIQMRAAIQLGIAAGAVVLWLLFLPGFVRTWRTWEGRDAVEPKSAEIVFTVLYVAFGLVAVIGGGVVVTDWSHWMAALRPELRLVLSILDKVLVIR